MLYVGASITAAFGLWQDSVMSRVHAPGGAGTTVFCIKTVRWDTDIQTAPIVYFTNMIFYVES